MRRIIHSLMLWTLGGLIWIHQLHQQQKVQIADVTHIKTFKQPSRIQILDVPLETFKFFQKNYKLFFRKDAKNTVLFYEGTRASILQMHFGWESVKRFSEIFA